MVQEWDTWQGRQTYLLSKTICYASEIPNFIASSQFLCKEELIRGRTQREDRLGGSSKILLLVNEFTHSFNQQIFSEYHYVLGLMLGDPKVSS